MAKGRSRGLSRMTGGELAVVAAAILSCFDGWCEPNDGSQTEAEKALERAYDHVWSEGCRRFGDDDFAVMRDQAARTKGLAL